MKHLAALLSLTLLTTAAGAQNDPDIEVYQPVATLTPVPKGVVAFDADWTANRKIAMAYVEDHGSAHKLIIATFDPTTLAFVKLGEIMAKPWRIPEISLAVPEIWYGDIKRDRIYVAASIQSTPVGYPEKVVNGVRLFSVTIDSKPSKLSVALLNLVEMATMKEAEPPHAQVNVMPLEDGYAVDLAFIDPNSQVYEKEPVLGCDGQVMLARSFDYGLTATAHHVTGGLAPNCVELQKAMGLSRYGRLALAADFSNGSTLLAVEDLENDVIHVLHGDPAEKQVQWFARTPDGDQRPEFAPRMACAEGRFSMTCLTGLKGSAVGNELTWFSGRLAISGSFTEFSRLHANAATPGDIDVRGSDAWIVAGCFDPWLYLTAVQVPDDGLSTGSPRVGVSPEGTPKRGSYFFKRPKTQVPEGVRMDP